jgi:hypothetical protein
MGAYLENYFICVLEPTLEHEGIVELELSATIWRRAPGPSLCISSTRLKPKHWVHADFNTHAAKRTSS